MSQLPFVHLRLHSEYSVTDGIVRLDEAVAAAVSDGMPALALTDLANVFGMVKFYKEARSRGVKPIIGCDVWIENASDRDKPSRLLLLCQSRTGYRNLCDLLTRAYRTNQYRGRAELKQEWFVAPAGDGLIALSGAHLGDVGLALLAGNHRHAVELARAWAALFPQRYYLELQRLQTDMAAPLENCVQQSLQLASELKLPVVATHPVQFLKSDDFKAHEARVCIAEGYKLSDQRRPRLYSPDHYFKTQAEMGQLYADIPQALANAFEIARRCNLEIELGISKLPDFPTPDGQSLDDYLRGRAQAGLEIRMQQRYPDAGQCAEKLPEYQQRLEFEIKTIVQMGFPGYFLIVADFINWAKQNGVPVGPGRGSGAGSLVAYSLGITDLDPLRYNLLFERFLNPERVSMPDFDIDFCQDGRDRVIEYVRGKFGADSVSQIATFGTMAARAVVRDVGRVLDLGYNFCDQIAKLIPFQPGQHITLAKAREMEPLLKEREKNEEEVRELLELGERLEGMTRNVGMHAGGVLIAPGKLTDFCPLYTAEGSAAAVSQFDMKDIEQVGLVKFDFLGLTTLTILDWTLRYIKRLDAESQITLEGLPLDDAAAYKIFSGANTTAVFQFESRGMRDLLKQARPDRFEDIIALVALYRPGPMELIPDYVARKNGRRFDYPDPRVESVLAETYGIMVYQEQVMQMAQIVGGYSLGAADLLRRAMGKKLPEEMAQQRGLFSAGAAKNGVKEGKARELFDLMEKFAGYGFNKSHAAAYALVAYQTAYFKAHHAAAFMAANLSAVMDDTDKVRQFHEDTVNNGLKVLRPDINSGEYRFVPLDSATISYGLGAVKGTGESAISAIVASRAGKDGRRAGPFEDLFDFCERVDKRIVNRRVIEALIRAGAFDAIDDHRARMLASVGIAIGAAEQIERNLQQVSLFGGADAAAHSRPALIEVPRWDKRTVLKEEKVALGYYLSGHPFTAYRDEIGQFVRTSLDRLTPSQGYGNSAPLQTIAGVVESVRFTKSQTSRMAIVALGDGRATQEVVIYGDIFDQYRKFVVEDAVLVMEVKVRNIVRGGQGGDEPETSFTRITAEKIYDLDAARNRYARGVRLTCNGQSSASKLREMLAPYRNGNCPVTLVYTNQRASCEIELGDAWRVNVSENLLQSLGAWLSEENVKIVYN